MLKACKYCGRVHDRDYDCGKRPLYQTKRTKWNRTEEEAGRYSYAFAQKSREVKERQHYLCPICMSEGKIKAQPIETHHIIKLRDRPDLLLEDANLIGLCVEHHKMADEGRIEAAYLRQLAQERDG